MLDYLLNAAVTLFVTLDPIGLTPLFMTVTAGRARAERLRIARTACIIAGIVLVFFSLVGEPMIRFLGITLPAFRIAGGLLLFWIAFEMVFGLRQRRKTGEIDQHEQYENVAAFPLAVPLMAGPGAISATILISSRAPDTLSRIGLEVIILSLIGICFAVFLLADPIERVLKSTGRIVVTRLLGVMLAALSVQIVADGVIAFAAPLAEEAAAAP